MAFFKLGKKKKEESLDVPLTPPDLQTPQAAGSPIDQVTAMKQHGYSNNQIIQALQSEGYNTSQIYDAINQANLSFQQMPEQPEIGVPDYGQYEQQSYQQPHLQQPIQPLQQTQPASIDDERIQEIAEAVIDEKWNDFASEVKKIIEWKDKSEERLSKIEQQIIDIRLSIDSLIKSIMSKISAYDQNIIDVGTEMKAMEKVFQKVLPTLTESVNKLDRMTKSVKEPQKK